MKAYISVSFQGRIQAEKPLMAIAETLNAQAIDPFIFVDNYLFDPAQEKEMMLQAMKDIDNSDLLIAEVSDKAIGIGVEAGYAKGRQKHVIYIRRDDAEHSTTVAGISDYQVIYSNEVDLQQKLAIVLKANSISKA